MKPRMSTPAADPAHTTTTSLRPCARTRREARSDPHGASHCSPSQHGAPGVRRSPAAGTTPAVGHSARRHGIDPFERQGDQIPWLVLESRALLPCRFGPRTSGSRGPTQRDSLARSAVIDRPRAGLPSCFTDLVYRTMWEHVEAAIEWRDDPTKPWSAMVEGQRRQHASARKSTRKSRKSRRRRRTGDVCPALDLRSYRVRSVFPSQGVELEEIGSLRALRLVQEGCSGPLVWVQSDIAPTLLRVGDFLSLGLDRATGPRPELQDLVVVPPSRMTDLWCEMQEPHC